MTASDPSSAAAGVPTDAPIGVSEGMRKVMLEINRAKTPLDRVKLLGKLPANLGIMVSPGFTYILGDFTNAEGRTETLVIAKALLEAFTAKTGFHTQPASEFNVCDAPVGKMNDCFDFRFNLGIY